MSAPMPAGRALGAPLLARDFEPTIFEFSVPGRHAAAFRTTDLPAWTAEELVPEPFRRSEPVALPEVSERDLVAHFTRLTHRQYSVDLGAYPLGSCTMKYNPKAADAGAVPASANSTLSTKMVLLMAAIIPDSSGPTTTKPASRCQGAQTPEARSNDPWSRAA